MLSRTFASVFPWIVAALMVVAAVLQPLPYLMRPAHAGSTEVGTGSVAPRETGSDGTMLPLSLQQTVLLALDHNPDIRIDSLIPLIREEEVGKEQGAFFEPVASLDTNLIRNRQQAGSLLAGAEVTEADSFDVDAGVRTRIPTGAVLSLDWRTRRSENNSAFQRLDPQYSADLALTLTHPLLKNFGLGVNRTKIKVAQNNLEMSKHQLRVAVTNLVSEVQQVYWDLVLASQDVEARRRSLELTQHLQGRAQEMVAAGRLPALAILEAKVGVKQREIDLLSGENALADAQARLKSLLDLGKGSGSPIIVPIDQPRSEVGVVSVEEGVKSALEKRPELLQAQVDQESRQLAVKLARNQTLPELNFVGGVSLSGLSGEAKHPTDTLGRIVQAIQGPNPFEGGYAKTLDTMLSGNYVSYKVGIAVQVPLSNQSARSELQKAKLEAEKAKFSIETLEQKIVLEIERAARGLRASAQTIEGAKALRELAEQKLKMAQEGLELGASSVTAVLESEKDLTLARRDELKATLEYNKTAILWEKATGVTLERFGITL